MVTDMIKSIAIDLPRPSTPAVSGNPAIRGAGPASFPTSVEQGSDARQASAVPKDEVEELREAVRDLNSYVQNVQRNLQFSVDEDSGHTVIKVVDAATEELVRQIPSEEVLALARHLKEMSGEQVSGLLVQSHA